VALKMSTLSRPIHGLRLLMPPAKNASP
jgi:hypothetical protein